MIKLLFDFGSRNQLNIPRLKLFNTQCDLGNEINSVISGLSRSTGNVGTHIDNILYQEYGWNLMKGWSNNENL